MLRLEGKVAAISGGNSGIGLAIAQRFAKEGAHVFIFARRQAGLDEAVTRIGGNVTAIQADATRLGDLDRVADVVRSTKGKVDVVVSSAGVTESVPLRDITPEHYDRVFALNARAPLFLMANHSAYAATKAALRSFTRTWAAEFKDSGIRANTLIGRRRHADAR
jgi:NAD(P)-dependent dehydrogenase (short-subunit alcohol dehydrogenase family)